MINEQLYKQISEYIDNNIENEFEKELKCFNVILDNESIEANHIELNDSMKYDLEESFSQRLLKIIDSKNLSDSDVYNKANIDRRLFSKIRSNIDYSPSKQTVLAFCIALKLDIDDTEDLLQRAGYALSYSNRADLIVRYFIEEIDDYTLFDVDEALLSFDQKPISKY